MNAKVVFVLSADRNCNKYKEPQYKCGL